MLASLLNRIRQTYFDTERQRIDPVVALNVLTLFYSHGRGDELAQTLEWVLGVLEHRAYLNGTRYYETAECFLFFASRLLRTVADTALHAQLAPILRERILERSGAPGDALALSMRVLAGAVVGVRMERDLAALLPLQCEDGGWGQSWIYKYGSSDIKIGNRGLTTALALKAIAALDEPQLPSPSDRPAPQSRSQSPSLSRSSLVDFVLCFSKERSGTPTSLLPSPPLSPTHAPKRAGRKTSVAGAVVKGIYSYFFPYTDNRKQGQASSILRNLSVTGRALTLQEGGK